MTNSILSILALLVLTQLSTFVAAQEIIDVFRWVVPYSGPTEFEARVGDTMVFRWAQGMHNVYIHPSMSCDFEGAILVGSNPGTPYTFVEADGSPEGNDMFFACNIGNGAHCVAGQAIVVKVFSDAASVSPSFLTTDATESPTLPESEDSGVSATEIPTLPPTVGPTSTTTSSTTTATTTTTTLRGSANVSSDFISANATDFPTFITDIDDNITDVGISQVSDEPVVAEAPPTDAPLVDEPVVADEVLPIDAPSTLPTDAPLVDEPVVADEVLPIDAPSTLPTDASLIDEPAVADEPSATEATEMPVEETKPADETSTNVDAAQAASGCRANSVASLVGLTFACLALVLV